MNDFKQRLNLEQSDLEDKINKLEAFFLSVNINKVEDVQKALLSVQLTSMKTYNQCLKERIERL